MKKSLFTSKTMWINLITGAAGLLGAFGIDVGLDEETKMKIVVGGIAAGNMVLRLVTKVPIL